MGILGQYGRIIIAGALLVAGSMHELSAQLAPVEICIATVDPLSTHNIIIWEKPISASIDSFVVYRAIGNGPFVRAGAVSYQDLSVYYDFGANPNTSNHRYRVAAKGINGTEGTPGPYHRTIHLNHFEEGKFEYNQYEVENFGEVFSAYHAQLVDTDGMPVAPIDTLITFIIEDTTLYVNTAQFPADFVVIETFWDAGINCTARTNINTTRSNIERTDVVQGIGGPSPLPGGLSFSVFPNPASGSVFIGMPPGNSAVSLALTDLSGRVLLTEASATRGLGQKVLEMGTDGLPKGVYLIRVRSESGAGSERLVVR